MATKAMLMKLLQESRGYEQITNRRPIPRPVVLYLMQLRAQNAHARGVKRRFVLRPAWDPDAAVPVPVNIKHIPTDDCELPIVFG